MINPEEEVCVIKWTVRDIVDAIAQNAGTQPNEEMIKAVIDEIKDDLADLCIERGWEIIENAVIIKPWRH